ncbi:penicillin-binding transpeptidase domain-containing protein [Thiovibrio frasassiensis]|uniref:beta-lactamase n=1 Tax=Thiovibrio frasassiensis TaxID=2984131 RepID=A0A9X4RLB4_9BACT|nr:penicillin-binding transpeptidase domain-containing protein [Thiovibrio frasassiensis]MDG4475911.1 penicillin-binding transpeptidase domain-containing protein [Thiovibrio frasassiensis]
MKKRAMEGKDRKPAMVGGFFLLLALVFVAVAIKSQFFEGSGQPEQSEGPKDEQASVVRGGGRRNIYDRNFMELAVSFQRSSLYARPLELEAPEEVAREVAKILGLDEKNILSALKGERSFAWLGRDLSREKAVKIADLNLKGVYRINQVQRFYPGNQLGAHVIGFIKDEQGLAGVEFYYDSVLRGGGVYDQRLAAAGVSRKIAEGSDSASLILTLDIHLQNVLEQKLKTLVQNTGAKGGVAVLMVPDTGEIIGLASLPDYDPNRFWEFRAEARRNRAIEDVLDLGAMDRLFQAAAVMEKRIGQKKNVLAEDEPAPEMEAVQRSVWNEVQGGRYISLEGVGFGQTVLGRDEYNAFADRIGLTVKGEVDLPEALFTVKDIPGGVTNKKDEGVGEESSPDPSKTMVPHPDKDSVATATPLALLSAFCRLINGGQVMTPHVLRAVWQDEQVWDVPVRQGIGEFAVPAQVSANMRNEMKKAAGAGRGNFLIESLLQKNSAVSSEAQSAGDGGENTVAGKAVMESILLGMAPLEHPEIAMIVVLEDARLDLQSRSPVRDLAEEMMPQARAALQNQVKPPSAKELAVREGGYYKKMEMIQAKSTLPAALGQGPQGLVMPDVRGLSGRKAMQILQPYGVRLQITGSGQVASQYPLAGSALRGVEECVLNLKAMQ